MTDKHDDPVLQRLVTQLHTLALVEITLRGALLMSGSGARRSLDQAVQSALRTLAHDPRMHGAVRCLRHYQRGVSRRRSVANALKGVVAERRATRVRVDARAAELGTTVPPLQWRAPSLTAKEWVPIEQRTDALLDEYDGLDDLDVALGSADADEVGGS